MLAHRGQYSYSRAMGLTKIGLAFLFGDRVLEVTECNARQISRQDLLAPFMLKSMFHDHPKGDREKQSLLQLIRLAEMAAEDYEYTRSSLRSFVADPVSGALDYLHALHRVEGVIGNSWRFCNLVRGDHRLFERDEGNVFEALNKLYNTSKHKPATATGQPLWFTNSGVMSQDLGITYDELANTVESLSNICLKVLGEF